MNKEVRGNTLLFCKLTSKTVAAAALNSRLSFVRLRKCSPLYSPWTPNSIRTSRAVAGSRRSHSSPLVSGTGRYGVIKISDKGRLMFVGRRRRACKVIPEDALQMKTYELTSVFRDVGALDASANSRRHLA